jgi:predicted DNA-binding transcriptional regulator YafY
MIHTMPTHLRPLTARVRPQAKSVRCVASPVLRQWRLLEQLSSTPKGATIKEMAAASGVSHKTVRRDLRLLKQLGFDLVDAEDEDFGRKCWRIRHPFESLASRPEQYRLMHDSLQHLREQAKTLGNSTLAADLKAIQLRVQRKCNRLKSGLT